MRTHSTPRRALARVAALAIAAAAVSVAWAPAQAQAGESDSMEVAGTIWQDKNADGFMDPDEGVLSGLTVTVDPCPPAGACEVTTDENGYYSFGILPAADSNSHVYVDLGQNGGYSMSDDNVEFTWDTAGDSPKGMAVSTDIPAEPGSVATRNLGLYEGEGESVTPDQPQGDDPSAPSKPGDKPGGGESGNLPTITGFVWADKDSDGVQDKGEPGMKGRTVTLKHQSDMKCETNPDCTATTDDKGKYTIVATGGGSGRVVIDLNLGGNDGTDATFAVSPKGKGEDRSLDSDVAAGGIDSEFRGQAFSDEVSFSEGRTTEVDAGLKDASAGGAGGSDEGDKGGLPVTGVGLTAVIVAAITLLGGGIALAVGARRRKRAAAQPVA